MSNRGYSVQRDISAPPDRVWALLADSETWVDWNPTVTRIEGPIRAGGTVELVSTVNPKRTFKLRVTEIDAPNRMVWADGMPLGLFTGTRTYLVEPVGDGSASRFVMTERYTGPLAPLVTRAIPDLSDSFEQFADGLKAGAEAD